MDGKKLEYKGDKALKELDRLTRKADEVQENLLREILTRNGETEYLNKYLFGSKDISEFKKSVPVITYKAIRPYIQRIANGEASSLITAHPITEMLCRSLTIPLCIMFYFIFATVKCRVLDAGVVRSVVKLVVQAKVSLCMFAARARLLESRS